MRRAIWAAAVLALALVAGCSSSSSSGGPSASPGGGSTPASQTTSPTMKTSLPSPSPTKSVPLSPFEADPAVMALRTWAVQAARTVNAGRYTDKALRSLMTADFARTMKNILGGEVGHKYPGPVPFTPTRVAVTSSTARDVRICVVSDGFSLNPKTGKPFAKHHVKAIDSGAVLSHGTWLVSKFDTGSFSCSGVKIKEAAW